jgi:hypothetical protein
MQVPLKRYQKQHLNTANVASLMLLEVALVMIHVILPIQSLARISYSAHPTDCFALRTDGVELRPLLHEFLRDGFDINVKIVSQKFSYFGIFVIADQSFGDFGG